MTKFLSTVAAALVLARLLPAFAQGAAHGFGHRRPRVRDRRRRSRRSGDLGQPAPIRCRAACSAPTRISASSSSTFLQGKTLQKFPDGRLNNVDLRTPPHASAARRWRWSRRSAKREDNTHRLLHRIAADGTVAHAPTFAFPRLARDHQVRYLRHRLLRGHDRRPVGRGQASRPVTWCSGSSAARPRR